MLSPALALSLLVVGCSHRHQPTVAATAAAPPLKTQVAQPPVQGVRIAGAERDDPDLTCLRPIAKADAQKVATGTPVYSEVGKASWYGPPYNRRRGANGQIYDQEAMTAAHRTLPMNSLLRVTNVQTGQSAIMRVTDRGPFVPDRVLDLSLASARAVGVYRPGDGAGAHRCI